MARRLRLNYPRALSYITVRGNAQRRIFLDEADYRWFLTLLGMRFSNNASVALRIV